jgi:hypothetical protein
MVIWMLNKDLTDEKCKFGMAEQRLRYWKTHLLANPLLLVVLLHRSIGACYGMKLVYGNEKDAKEKHRGLVKKLRTMNLKRGCYIADAVFRGHFNIHPALGVESVGEFKSWIKKAEMDTLFNGDIREPTPPMLKFPVLSVFSNHNRTVPWPMVAPVPWIPLPADDDKPDYIDLTEE